MMKDGDRNDRRYSLLCILSILLQCYISRLYLLYAAPYDSNKYKYRIRCAARGVRRQIRNICTVLHIIQHICTAHDWSARP